jgi:hypothetical protein
LATPICPCGQRPKADLALRYAVLGSSIPRPN